MLQFDVVNRKLIKNISSDALSRLRRRVEDWTEVNDDLPVLIIKAGMTFDATSMACAICDVIKDVNTEILEVMTINIVELVTPSTE